MIDFNCSSEVIFWLGNWLNSYLHLKFYVAFGVFLFFFVYQEFLSNINNLHTVVWFQVFLSDINNLQTELFESYTGLYQVLPLRVRVDLGLTVMKESAIFPRARELRAHP